MVCTIHAAWVNTSWRWTAPLCPCRLQIRFFACITLPTARQKWMMVLSIQILQQAPYSWQARLQVTWVAEIYSDVHMKHPFAAHIICWQW